MKQASERYAAALLRQSSDEGQRERVTADLALLVAIMDQLPGLERMCGTSSGARRLYAVLESAVAPHIHILTRRFLSLLHANRRLSIVREIAAAFSRQADVTDNVIAVRVESAYPLSETLVTAIAAKVGIELSMWPRMTSSVNPSLIGGFVVSHGDRVHDFSLAGAMQQLRQRLTSDAAERGIA